MLNCCLVFSATEEDNQPAVQGKGPVKCERGARSGAARCPFAWPRAGSPLWGWLCSEEARVEESPQLLPSTEVSGFSGSCRACTEEMIAMSMWTKSWGYLLDCKIWLGLAELNLLAAKAAFWLWRSLVLISCPSLMHGLGGLCDTVLMCT